MALDPHPAPCGAAAQLTIEQTLFDSLPASSPTLRVWQPLPALIATSAEAAMPAFAPAAARASARGLPVHVRRSGGGAVCLGPGMLVVTHLYTSAHNDINRSYRKFAEKLLTAIADVGMHLAYEHVPQAYCDGRFDLAWQGRKVGGIAQRRRVLEGRAHVWIHAVIAIERQCLRYPEAVTTFYAELGSSRVADPRSTTSLSECLPPGVTPTGLMQRCCAAIIRAFDAPAGVDALL